MKYHLPLVLRWDIGSPKPILVKEYNEVIRHIKKVCAESINQRGYRKVKLDHFYLEDNKYYFLCSPDPSYSAMDVVELFDILSEPVRWSVLDNFTYEPVDYLSYCYGINPHYRLKILDYQYHGKLQELLIQSCKDIGINYLDSKILQDQVTVFVSVPINKRLNTIAGGIKSRMTYHIKRELHEVFNKYVQYKKKPFYDTRPRFWSSGTFIAISSKKMPDFITIQPKLESFTYKPSLEYINLEIERIKQELFKEFGSREIILNRNMYLLYKIQILRSKINESQYKKYGRYVFEMTPQGEKYSLIWSFIQCKNKIQLDQFLGDTQSFVMESLRAPGIVNIKDFNMLKTINALRIDVSHDLGMTYDSRTKENIRIANDFYAKVIGKTIPDCVQDYLDVQTEVLMLVLETVFEIERKYCK
jgi:REP element-mobilizing transposase RayT